MQVSSGLGMQSCAGEQWAWRAILCRHTVGLACNLVQMNSGLGVQSCAGEQWAWRTILCRHTVGLACNLVQANSGHAEWIITVGHRPNSEPNLPRVEQFNERADTVAGLPASAMKGVVKRQVWQ